MQSNTTNRRPDDLSFDDLAAAVGEPEDTLDAPVVGAAGLAPSARGEPSFKKDSSTLGAAGRAPSLFKRSATRGAMGWVIALLVVAGLAVSFVALRQHRADDGQTPGLRGEAAPNAAPDYKPR